jgi:hypothetical protein
MKRQKEIKKMVVSIISMIIIITCYAHNSMFMIYAQGPKLFIPDEPIQINSHSPMYDAAEMLEGMYLKPVTYEDPILVCDSDLDSMPLINGEMRRIPKRRSFSMPSDANPKNTPILDSKLLREVLDAYENQTNGPHFRVTGSSHGLHIIPAEVRDRNDRYVRAITFMDAIITVPVKIRTPSEHIKALCDAINASSRMNIELHTNLQYFDQYFSQVRISRTPTAKESEKISFPWGIDRIVARDALDELLEQSATTMTWALLCDTKPLCVLNMYALVASYEGPDGKQLRTALSHDRKKMIEGDVTNPK